MAEAHLALSGDLPGLRTLVVVKRILPHLSSSEKFVRMFHDEARIGALLDHPNIARVIEVGRDDDGYFLVMEAVQGKTLAKVLRQTSRRERRLGHGIAAFVVAEAASALAYAHQLTCAQGRPLNVVHRDVSPENILVSFEGAIKVIDFGIATSLGRLTETRPGGHKGKVAYMSPEQILGGVLDRRSDIFSLGIVLWEAVCGRALFPRKTDLAMVRAIVDEPITRPSAIVEISPRLERIIMRALERDPEDRFQDAQEMGLQLLRHAFASDGFSPSQVGQHMRGLFASDHAAWRAAMDAGRTGPRKITARFPPIPDADRDASGLTAPLFRLPQPAAPSVVSSCDLPSGEQPALNAIRSDRPVRPSRSWLAASILLLCLIGGADHLFKWGAPAPLEISRAVDDANGAGALVCRSIETAKVAAPVVGARRVVPAARDKHAARLLSAR